MRTDEAGEFASLFDGATLDGWRPVPRVYGRAWPAGPTVAEPCSTPATAIAPSKRTQFPVTAPALSRPEVFCPG
jgi:hypothetical protein